MRRSKGIRVLQGLGLALAACALTLLLAELLLRTFLPQLSPLTRGGYLDPHPVLGWVLHPGWHESSPLDISINSLGMRDGEMDAKSPTTFRVLAVGDSFTFGTVPLDETYVKRLEKLLREQDPGSAVEVINGGVPGYSPTQELEALRRWLPSVQPDAILLGLFVGNDFEELEPTRAADAHVVDGTLVDAKTAASPPEPPMVLARTHLFQLLRKAWRMAFVPVDEEGREKRHAWLELHRLRVYFTDPGNDDWWQLHVGRMREALTSFKELAESRHIPLVVAIFPDVVQVEKQIMEKVASLKPNIDKVALDFERPQRELVHMLEQLGLPALDLLPAFRDRAAAAALYRHQDTHWNREGNDLAATEILPALTRLRADWRTR
jgi:hypothetical protein